jgi:redox-sensing transcriptional repressor
LTVPAGVDVRKVDLSVELQVLAFLDQQRDGAPPVVAALRAQVPGGAR